MTNPSFGAPPGPTIAVTSTPANPEPGEAITFTATLTPPTAPPACNTQASPQTCYPSGSVSWKFTSTSGIPPQPCTPTTLTPTGGNASAATCVIPGSQVAAGTYQVAVGDSGDPAYGPASALGATHLCPKSHDDRDHDSYEPHRRRTNDFHRDSRWSGFGDPANGCSNLGF